MGILGTNWRTNSAAVLTSVGTIITIGAAALNGNLHLDTETVAAVGTALSVIWGFFAAKDSNVTGGTVSQTNPYLPTPRTR